MKVPFTIEQFLNVFESYNLAVWPMQIIFFLLALTAVFFSLIKPKFSDKLIALILAFFWIWMGSSYQLLSFTFINKFTYIVGFLFIIQGIFFLFEGLIKSNLSFKFRLDIYGVAGIIFIIFALIVYPLLSYFFGHVYPKTPTFGAPSPTTIFTFGMLLLTNRAVHKYLLIVPFLWSAISFSSAVSLTIKEDFGLFFAGLIGVVLIVIKNRNYNKK